MQRKGLTVSLVTPGRIMPSRGGVTSSFLPSFRRHRKKTFIAPDSPTMPSPEQENIETPIADQIEQPGSGC